jgi:hypothetical protein
LARNIYSSVGDIGIQDAFNTGVNLLLVRESSLATAYPVVTQFDIGTDPNQVPLNGYLGTMAFQDSAGVAMGAASVDLGTAAAPSISFTGDSNTGIYSPGADQFAISTGGTGRVFVDASGRVGVGTNSPSQTLHIVGASLANNFVVPSTTGYFYDVTGQNGLFIYGSTNGSTPNILSFNTTGTERARIDSSGRLLIGTATANTSGAKLQTSDGLTFPATAVASADPNTLDDYEEGTFTPSYKADTTNPTLGYGSINRGKYTRIGRIVHVQIMLQSTAVSVTGSGSLFVGDLPFSPQVDDFGGYGTFSIGWNTAFNLATGERIGAIIDGNSGKLRIIAQNDDTASYTTLAAGALSSIPGGAFFLLSGSYLVA